MALPYQYQPLSHDDETRLLHLEPGLGDDSIQVTLNPARLGEKPSYEAISYCWGDAGDTREIHCEGQLLHVTISLFTALKRLRKQNAARVLWVDAVCINQADVAEKNRQVQLMSRIYAQPNSIIIWLGDDTSGLEDLHECLQRANELLPPEHHEWEAIYAVSREIFREASRLRREHKPNFNDHDWRPLTNVLCRPWFNRRWIVQEVTLADDSVPRVAMCGDIEFSWTDMASVAYRLGVYSIMPLLAGISAINYYSPYMESFYVDNGRPIIMMAAAFMTYMLKTYGKKLNIVDCVTATALFQCSDPRDHLYSLLSVTPNCSGLEANYNLSVQEVCMRFAVATLISDQDLRVLSLAPYTTVMEGGQKPVRLALPSWVPDLTCQGIVNPLVSYTIRPQLFHAGGNEKPNARISPDGQVLHMRGRIIDKVEAMARCQIDVEFSTEEEVHPKSGFHARWKKRTLNWFRDCVDVAGEKYWKPVVVVPPPPPKPRLLRLLDFLLCGLTSKKAPPAAERSREEIQFRRDFVETLMCGMTTMRDPIPEEVLDAGQVYVDYIFGYFQEGFELTDEVRVIMLTYGALVEQSLLGVTESRRFCRTEEGRLGQVRTEAQEGDLFVVIVGAEVPYLLRPTEEEGVYTLVGDAFLLGVMQGEALADDRYETVDIAIE